MVSAVEEEVGRLVQVATELVDRSPFQPRRDFMDADLEELCESIQQVGVIQPLVVRAKKDGRYELIAGERRLRAARRAGLQSVPVVVRAEDDALAASSALIENVQRVDLNPMEIAEALAQLMEQQGLNQEKVSQKVGKKRSTVANYLRLLTLPRQVKAGLRGGTISFGHAKVVLSLSSSERQVALYTKIVRDSLNVREAEQAALRMAEKPRPRQRVLAMGQDAHLRQIGEELQRTLGTRVELKGRGQTGKVVIDYYSLDDLERLMERLGVEL